MVIKKSLLASLFLVLIFWNESTAQQDAQYTQYMFNTMSVNPAYAGSRGGQLSAAALYRSQWVGVDGAPETFTLNLHSPIRNSRVGYGLSVVNDKIGEGTVQETYLDALVSYTIDVSLKGKLSFGLKLGGKFLNLDFAQLQQRYDPDEQEFLNGDNIDNKFSPNFGLGLYYHTDKFYAGLSAPPNLLETEHFNDSSTDSERNNFLSKERINFYLITGYVFDLNDNLKFKPALLTKVLVGLLYN